MAAAAPNASKWTAEAGSRNGASLGVKCKCVCACMSTGVALEHVHLGNPSFEELRQQFGPAVRVLAKLDVIFPNLPKPQHSIVQGFRV